MRRRTIVRILFLGVIVGSTLAIVPAALGGYSTVDQAAGESNIGRQAAPGGGGVTVVTGQGLGDRGAIMAVNDSGHVIYYNSTRRSYLDVDPSPTGTYTVTYIARKWSNETQKRNCHIRFGCTHPVVERVNLTTGEVTKLYEATEVSFRSGSWHDVDRVDASTFAVADISNDEAFVLDIENRTVEWGWRAQDDFRLSSGGEYPHDWTHINDVEMVEDDLMMVSLRNQDRIVFVDRQRGLLENMTLGGEDEYSVLNEQHNPDYIPASEGGPAVLVADSQNDRIVEYQRSNGSWKRSWVWQDGGMAWPRDADRLPNGNTLITDTFNDRVAVVDGSGTVVWSMSWPHGYDAERLGTGDESTDGPSAVRADLASVGAGRVDGSGADRDDTRSLRRWFTAAFPGMTNAINSVLFVLPRWVGFAELVALGSLVGTVGLWFLFELGLLLSFAWRRGYRVEWLHRRLSRIDAAGSLRERLR